jgi:hypothetical protein
MMLRVLTLILAIAATCVYSFRVAISSRPLITRKFLFGNPEPSNANQPAKKDGGPFGSLILSSRCGASDSIIAIKEWAI